MIYMEIEIEREGMRTGTRRKKQRNSIVPKAPRERESIVRYNQKGKIVEFVGTIH